MASVKKAGFGEWVETAEALVKRSANEVACPCCGSSALKVRDVEYGFGHEKGVQRYMSCSCCGAFNGVNLRRAGTDSMPILRAAE
jgi:transposase-like protein